MLTELSKEQEALLDVVAKEWIQNANGGNTTIDKQKATECLIAIYALANFKAPKVVFMNGPMAAIDYCKKTLRQEVGTIDWFGVGFDSGWVALFDYFQRIGVLDKDDKEFIVIKEFMLSGVWSTIMFDSVVVCISRPNTVKIDERGRVHAEDGPAVAFDDGYKEYAWHGTWVTERIIMQPDTLTKEYILAEKNSEVSRAIAERLGWEKYLSLTDVVLVHKWFDERFSNHYELYDFKNRAGSLQPRLLKMESPELNDGTRPHYIEPVPPEALTCQAARRWQCDPDRPSIEVCNNDSKLEFEIEA